MLSLSMSMPSSSSGMGYFSIAAMPVKFIKSTHTHTNTKGDAKAAMDPNANVRLPETCAPEKIKTSDDWSRAISTSRTYFLRVGMSFALHSKKNCANAHRYTMDGARFAHPYAGELLNT